MSQKPSEAVIREVATDVWTFSVPLKVSGFLPVGSRTTAIKLNNGDVWVMASSPLDEETKTRLNELGPVKYIVSGDADHYFFLEAYHKEYPEAKVIGPEPLVKKAPNLKFTGVYGTDPAGTLYGFEEEINVVFFSGYAKRDVAFFHVASKSLIEQDLLFNLPPTEQFSKSKSSGTIPFFSGRMYPGSFLHKRVVSGLIQDKEAVKRDATAVAAWDFERIITAHGDVIEKDGKKAWTDVYKPFM